MLNPAFSSPSPLFSDTLERLAPILRAAPTGQRLRVAVGQTIAADEPATAGLTSANR